MKKEKLPTTHYPLPTHTAFTLIELIFVMVLMGILAGVGFSLIPNHHLLNDSRYVLLQIKNQQKNAIGYDVTNFSTSPWKEPDANSSDYNRTCVEFDKTWLEARDKNSSQPYHFNSQTSIASHKPICFDNLGRVYSSNALLRNIQNIYISYPNKPTKQILIYPYSGYAIISK